MSSIPGPGTSACPVCGQEKKEKEKKINMWLFIVRLTAKHLIDISFNPRNNPVKEALV